MKKDYLKVLFGSRGELEVDRRYIDKKELLERYNDFKKECIEEGYEYVIEEFGCWKEVGDGIIILGVSEEEREVWIEINDSNRKDIEKIEDSYLVDDGYEVIEEVIEKLEEKFEIEY
tara:strand:+ start:237 stop:587 length:351 start_codon:yes stop_codon:yes gene_type:complete